MARGSFCSERLPGASSLVTPPSSKSAGARPALLTLGIALTFFALKGLHGHVGGKSLMASTGSTHTCRGGGQVGQMVTGGVPVLLPPLSGVSPGGFLWDGWDWVLRSWDIGGTVNSFTLSVLS